MLITYKRFFLFFSLISVTVVMTSCQLHLSPNSPLQQKLNHDLDGMLAASFSSYNLSIDGDWLGLIEDGKLRVEPALTSGDVKFFELDNIGKYLYTNSWSPNKKMVAISGSEALGKCAEDRVGILNVKDTNEKATIFNLPDDDKGCLGAAWSPDSSYVAIYNGKNQIVYILDITSRLVRKIEFGGHNHINVIWTAKGLIVDAYNGVIDEIRMYPSPLDSEIYKVLFKDYSGIVWANSESGDALLVNRQGELKTLNSTTQEVTEIDRLKGSISGEARESIPPRWIGFIAYPLPSTKIEDRHLYVFDWDTNQFKDFGKAVFLFGWSSDMKGFIVVKDDLKKYQVDVVKP